MEYVYGIIRQKFRGSKKCQNIDPKNTKVPTHFMSLKQKQKQEKLVVWLDVHRVVGLPNFYFLEYRGRLAKLVVTKNKQY